MAELAAFSGFGPDGLAFLDGLAGDNSKAYFDAHRTTYEQQVCTPLKSLVVALGEQLRNRVSDDISFEPKVGRSMFRINRDLRFAKDKTPVSHPSRRRRVGRVVATDESRVHPAPDP